MEELPEYRRDGLRSSMFVIPEQTWGSFFLVFSDIGVYNIIIRNQVLYIIIKFPEGFYTFLCRRIERIYRMKDDILCMRCEATT